MRRSPTLDGYGTFIYMVSENEKTMTREKAVKKAVADCIKLNILVDEAAEATGLTVDDVLRL